MRVDENSISGWCAAAAPDATFLLLLWLLPIVLIVPPPLSLLLLLWLLLFSPQALRRLYLYYMHFPLADVFYLRGHLRLESSCIQINIHSFIHSIGMCRMRWFLAVLRSFFHSSVLYNLSFHPFPPFSHPSSLTSSCHLFLGLPLSLISKFIYNTFFRNSVCFHSLYMPKPT